uniref:Ig-like domain-containing protein n=1 Tax=Varanus komodoensis TaxID=61221 RepID=A0A8D2LQ91_VARKO
MNRSAARIWAASSHSLRYFYTAVSEPGQGLPQFVQVGYVDDQPITHYDSSTRRKRPAVPWMGKVGEDDAQYWERGTRKLHSDEQAFRESLATLQGYHNQSGGLHTLQWMFGCELRSDGSKGGYMQFGYDGRDFLSLDKETLRWTAADATAQLTKRKWEKDPAIAQGFKVYLEETCIEWLQRYLEYGKETLQRTEPPTVRVTRHKSSTEDVETLVCRAHGFYPKEIEAAWTRAGESREQETFRSRVAPNPDGTYYISLYTDVEPEERGLYRCRVAHASLSQPLALAWEGPAGLRRPRKGEGTDRGLGSGKLSFPRKDAGIRSRAARVVWGAKQGMLWGGRCDSWQESWKIGPWKERLPR